MLFVYSRTVHQNFLLQERSADPLARLILQELLVATRHVLSTDFRGAFLAKIDVLSNEKVLVGGGITSHETLRLLSAVNRMLTVRPLAYSMLADLLHHVRAELDSNQLRRTIAIYSANLHDDSLAPSIQTMCAKLLLNLIDRIIKLPDLKDGMSSSVTS